MAEQAGMSVAYRQAVFVLQDGNRHFNMKPRKGSKGEQQGQAAATDQEQFSVGRDVGWAPLESYRAALGPLPAEPV